MNSDLVRRIRNVERKLGSEGHVICAPLYLDETKEDGRKRIARWRAGEEIDGIRSSPTTDGSSLVIFFRDFCRWSDGSGVSQDEYAHWLQTGERKEAAT